MKENYPKILIISHNLYDTTNNIGKTLVSLFEGWPKDRISQIYFRNDKPSFRFCDEYYCITDKEILKSTLSFGKYRAGYRVFKEGDVVFTETEKNMYQLGNHRYPIISFVRDVLWNLGNWKTTELRKWISEVADPDVILFAPNDYCLAYRIALYVQKICSKPIVPFYMDDSFYWDCKTSGIDLYRRKQIRRLAEEVHKHSPELFTICEEMSEEYYKRYNVPCNVFVNSVPITEEFIEHKADGDIVISYLGNLHSNRWKAIVEVGKAIDKICFEKDVKISFRVYSASLLEDKVRAYFERISCLEFKGAIPAEKVREKQRASDILLHVEAFDQKSINSTKLSLSTKIPEYLSAGVCVFAYGPIEIASMKYLQKNSVAQICTEQEALKDKLEEIVLNVESRKRYAKSGMELAREKHDIKMVSKAFQERLRKNEG